MVEISTLDILTSPGSGICWETTAASGFQLEQGFRHKAGGSHFRSRLCAWFHPCFTTGTLRTAKS